MSNIIAGVTKEQTIGNITFKVKKGVAPQKTVIKFTNIKSNDGEQLISTEDINVEIEIIEDKIENNKPEDIVTPTSKPTDNGNNNSGNNTESNTGNNMGNNTGSNMGNNVGGNTGNNTENNMGNNTENNAGGNNTITNNTENNNGTKDNITTEDVNKNKDEHTTITLGQKDEINTNGEITIAVYQIPICLIIFILLIILLIKRRNKKETNEK